MTADKEFVFRIILERADQVEARYPSYKQDFKELLVDVIAAEREHLIAKTNIKQKIAEKIEASAQILSRKKS